MNEGTIDRLAALSVEAQRRGITYGQLMSRTSRAERDRIEREARGVKSGKNKRGK